MCVPPIQRDFNVFAGVKVQTLILWVMRPCSVLRCPYILEKYTASTFRHPENGGNVLH